jgi:hypothetical protein
MARVAALTAQAGVRSQVAENNLPFVFCPLRLPDT